MKKLIGLTGKTGSGKSTVSAFFKEKGAFVIDGDIVARDILITEPSILSEIKNAFGENTVINGELNRKELAKLAFSSPGNTKRLNGIFHPPVNKQIEKLANEAFEKYDIVIVDAAAIIESGFIKKCDLSVTVTAPFNIRLERIIKRDALTKEEALRRMNAQKDDAFYEKNADIIIHNDGRNEELLIQAENAFKKITDER